MHIDDARRLKAGDTVFYRSQPATVVVANSVGISIESKDFHETMYFKGPNNEQERFLYLELQKTDIDMDPIFSLDEIELAHELTEFFAEKK